MRRRREKDRTSGRARSGGAKRAIVTGAGCGIVFIILTTLIFLFLLDRPTDSPNSAPPETVAPSSPPQATTLPSTPSNDANTSAPTQATTLPSSSTWQAAPGEDSQRILERCLRGTVAFRYPKPVKQGETFEFVVRALLNGSSANPTEGLPGQGPAQTRSTRTCDQMRAELFAPDMVITPTGNESGVISLPSQGIGEWIWQIQPQKSGTQFLTLRLYVPGPGESDITLETFEERIQVDVGLSYVTKGFIKEYFPALGISVPVILGGIAWLVHQRRKGKHEAD